jgi:hypothetical protein
MLSFKYQTLLYMYKIKNLIKDFQPSHVYNTILKHNNNLNVPLNKTNFGNQSTVINGVSLLRYYNINIFFLLILINIKIMYLAYFLRFLFFCIIFF